MIAAALRGGNKPSLNEALGWIGSRVDDIYGSAVGRLEDVWIDPGTGAPRWLLVNEGRFGGRSTLVPFGDATAGAGHVWIPYEREVVRQAPEIEPGVPLTQQVEATLRNHYAANATAAVAHGSSPRTTHSRAFVRLASAESVPPASTSRSEGVSAPRLPQRPPPPVQPPREQQHLQQPYETPQPPPVSPPQAASMPYGYQAYPAQPPVPPASQEPQPQGYVYQQPAPPVYHAPAQPAPPPPAPDPAAVLAAIPAGSVVEIELEGNVTISGQLREVRITPPPV